MYVWIYTVHYRLQSIMKISFAWFILLNYLSHNVACELNNSTLIIGIKNSDLPDSENGLLRPWRDYYTDYVPRNVLEDSEMGAIDCLEIATQKIVLVRPFNSLGTMYDNKTWTPNSLLESIIANETDVAIRLLYAGYDKERDVDFMWDIGNVEGEIAMRKDEMLKNKEDLFLGRAWIGLSVLAASFLSVIALAIYLLATDGKSAFACFLGIRLATQEGVCESEFIEHKTELSGRLILIVGAFSALVCMTIYTAGLASTIAANLYEKPTITSLQRHGYKLILTEEQKSATEKRKRDFLMNEIQSQQRNFGKIARHALVTDGLHMGLVELLYSNKTVYLVGRSGALRREERSFAKSEAGKLVYIPLGIMRRASLPMTKNLDRRRVVLDALIRAKEAGLMELLNKAWLGKASRGSADDDKDDPSFEPAGIIQVKSVFAALLIGQIAAVVIGIMECTIGWPDRRGRIKNNQEMFRKKCPYCGSSDSKIRRHRKYSI